MSDLIVIFGFLEIAAIVVAAIVGYRAIVRQIESQRKLQKQNNSIRVISAFFSDHDLVRAARILAEIDVNPEDNVEIYAYANPPQNGDSEKWFAKSSALFSLINYFEIISVGIEADIYDRDIVRNGAQKIFATTYDRTVAFICKARGQRSAPNFGVHFERVAEEFKRD